MFALNWPSIRRYQRYQCTGGGPKAGGSLHPLLASGLASPQLLDNHHHRRPDRRLQHADNRQRRRRRRHHQHHRYYRSTQLPSQYQDHRRQHRSRHHPSSRDQLHRLLLQNHHRQRSRKKSPAKNTALMQYFDVDIEEEYPLHEKCELQNVTLQISRLSQKLQDYQETTKRSTSTYQSILSTIETTDIGRSSKGPTSKFYDEVWYEYIEQLYKRGTKQWNSAYWYDTLEKSCSDPLGGM